MTSIFIRKSGKIRTYFEEMEILGMELLEFCPISGFVFHWTVGIGAEPNMIFGLQSIIIILIYVGS